MNDLFRMTAEMATGYMESLTSRPVAPSEQAVAATTAFDGPLPEDGTDPEEVIRTLHALGTPATIAMAGPRFFGFVIGGALPVSVAANWLATAWDQNTGSYLTAATSVPEQVALKWLLELLHLPMESAVGFVTGATVANFTALAAARHSVLKRAGWNVEEEGLCGAPEIKVVVGREFHPSVMKSLTMLGFGRNRLIRCPVDGQGRMIPDRLPNLDGPAIVCTQAGNINTGAFDPIGEIADRVHRSGGWVHVDGAFGLWAAATPTRSHLTAGMERADSWATDGHKWLNLPFDSGFAFVRDAEAMGTALAITAEYLPPPGEKRFPANFTPELSRRARGVDAWAAIRHLGRKGVAEMIERCCRHATRFAEGLSEAGFEILNDVVLNQVLVSFGSPERTDRIIERIQKDGTCWCGGTDWQGRHAMRISICSWMTTDADVEMSLEAMIRAADSEPERP
ncbi:MAG: pyridoxal-dependent decarboxylase [Opitutaceae bacterium]